MKVILLRDVARVGKKYEVKEVADGYALNSLIPSKSAMPATAENLERVKAHRAKLAHADANDQAVFDAVVSGTKENPLVLIHQANAHGHLFKGVRAADVATALRADRGIALDPKALHMEPLKDVGEHAVTLRLGGREGTLNVIIKAQ